MPPANSNFPFVVECKNHEGNWTLENVVLDNLDIRNWWQQVIGDSRNVGLEPMLIFTRNRAKTFVMIPYDAEMYDVLKDLEHPVMRTTVSTYEKMTDRKELFDVLVTTQDGLFHFTPDYLVKRFLKNPQWEETTLISGKPEEVSPEDVSINLFKVFDQIKNV